MNLMQIAFKQTHQFNKKQLKDLKDLVNKKKEVFLKWIYNKKIIR